MLFSHLTEIYIYIYIYIARNKKKKALYEKQMTNDA